MNGEETRGNVISRLLLVPKILNSYIRGSGDNKFNTLSGSRHHFLMLFRLARLLPVSFSTQRQQ